MEQTATVSTRSLVSGSFRGMCEACHYDYEAPGITEETLDILPDPMAAPHVSSFGLLICKGIHLL